MKKVKGVAIVIAVLCLVLVFAACQPNTPIDPTPTPTPDPKPTPDPTPNPDPTPTWTDKAFKDFVGGMAQSGKYTYTVKEGGNNQTYDIDGDVVRLCVGSDIRGTYWAPDGENFYQYAWNKADSKFHKTKSDVVEPKSIVFNGLQIAKITDYNKDTDEYTATINGKQYLMKIDDDEMVFYDKDKTSIHTVSNIDAVKLSVPSGKIVVDETEKEPDPGPGPVDPTPGPDDPIIDEKDKIFTVDAQGNRVYNYQLLSESLLEALNTETNGSTLFNEIDFTGTTVESIKYVSISDGKIGFGAVTNSMLGTQGFTLFEVKESDITEADAKEILVAQLVKGDIISGETLDVIQYSTDSEDKEVAAKVATAAKNVTDRLATDGVQDRLENSGTPLDHLKDSEIVFAYTKENTRTSDGYGLGNVQFIGVKCIVKTADGEYRFVDTNVVTQMNSGYTPLDIVVEGKNNRFIVNKLNGDKQIDKELYTEQSTEKTVDIDSDKK